MGMGWIGERRGSAICVNLRRMALSLSESGRYQEKPRLGGFPQPQREPQCPQTPH